MASDPELNHRPVHALQRSRPPWSRLISLARQYGVNIALIVLFLVTGTGLALRRRDGRLTPASITLVTKATGSTTPAQLTLNEDSATPKDAAGSVAGFAVPSGTDARAEPLLATLQEAAALQVTPGDTHDVYARALQQYAYNGTYSKAHDPYAGDKHRSTAWKLASQVLELIATSKRVAPCSQPDPTLPAPVVRNGGRYLIAADLTQCDHLMPHYVLQLLRMVVLTPRGTVALSIYESGSSDNTPYWLDILRIAIAPLGITHHIVTHGNLTRSKFQERIEFLAAVRNAAIDPFFPLPTSTDARQCASGGSSRDQPACFQPTWVMFVNDVFLCPHEVLRLMSHGDADMACGMDFYEPAQRRSRRSAQRRALRSTREHKLVHQRAWNGERGTNAYKDRAAQSAGWPHVNDGQQRSEALFRLQAIHGTHGSTSEHGAALEQQPAFSGRSLQYDWERYLYLYWDIWVARDVSGGSFGGGPPYVGHQPTRKRAERGLPFQAYCCWGGLAKLRAAPFAAGLRFRTAMAGECRASECTLLCDDFHRLGLKRVVVDPNVRVTYTLELKTKAYRSFPALNSTLWAQAAVEPHWLQHELNYSRIECCNLKPGAHHVDFSNDCHPYDILATNYTARLPLGPMPGPPAMHGQHKQAPSVAPIGSGLPGSSRRAWTELVLAVGFAAALLVFLAASKA